MSASTQLLTDVASAISTGPSAASVVLANAAAGPIQDIPGNLVLAQLKLKEAFNLLTIVKSDLDAGDGIKTTVSNILLSLV